jgi:hypothetical protein
MAKKFSIVMGLVLVLTGFLVFSFSLVGPIFGFRIWRLWPLTVAIAGLFFVLPPLLVRGRRGLGALFIPGMPILATGGILLFTSLFGVWNAWEWLWPQEVLAVALGFLFAAVYMRLIWLVIPATVIGLNGVVLQFCALTGLWEWWTVLWVVEPLAVGLSLLVVAIGKRTRALFLAGLLVCGLAVVGFAMTVIIWSGMWRLFGLLGAATLILLGLLLLVGGLRSRPGLGHPAVESEAV